MDDVFGALMLGVGVWMVLSSGLAPATSEAVPRLVWSTPGAARGTPVSDGRLIYVRTSSEIAALDGSTGAVAWRTPIATAPGLVAGSRLVIVGDLVLGGDDRVEAFRRSDGARVWGLDVDGMGLGLYLGPAQDGMVFAGSYGGDVWAIDAATGAVRWRGRASPRPRTTVFVPVVDDDQIVATFTSFGPDVGGGVVAFDLSGRLRWRAWMAEPDGRGAVGACLSVDGLVLASGRSGTIYAFDRRDGRLRWSLPPPAGAGREDFRPVVAAHGLLVAGSLRGEVIAYDLSTRQERWRRWPVEASVAFHLAASDVDVLVPYVSGQVVSLDWNDGRERWRIGGADDGFRWSPLIAGTSLYVSGARRGVAAFRREERNR